MSTEQNGSSEGRELAVSVDPVEIRHLHGGVQAVFRFPNGFGASVVRTPFSYGGHAGKWELGITKWSGKDFELTYDTDISDDVIGYLNPAEVDALLLRIQSLDENGREPQIAEVQS